MYNPETQTSLGIRHRTKPNKNRNKTKQNKNKAKQNKTKQKQSKRENYTNLKSLSTQRMKTLYFRLNSMNWHRTGTEM